MRLVIALDGAAWDGNAQHLVATALAAVASPGAGSEVHLASVLPPAPISVASPSPVATAAAVAAVLGAQQQQALADEAAAGEVLAAAAAACEAAGVAADRIHTHVLPAAGGASGAGEALVARARGFDLIAVGSRGLGGLQRALQSLIGLGSVSDYVLHNSEVPVLVVRPRTAANVAPAAAAAAGKPRVIVVAVDASAHSAHALDWAASHLRLQPRDEVRVVSVAAAAPYPTLDEGAAAVAMIEAAEFQRANERNLSAARTLAARAAALFRGSVDGGAGDAHEDAEPGAAQPRALAEALLPEGGASDVGAAVVKCGLREGADLVVAGSRGMGAFKRAAMGMLGLGSVSDHLAHNFEGAVLVVKSTEAALQQAGEPQTVGTRALAAAEAEVAVAAAAARKEE
ncbi:hypothetical protein Rsub_11707 [Raphidocelis subcapitata]|uniref:UspA domain-containing protein n=1 Tax=Raphidocelis subcapitata TaxID=307507 RepID=A0A2V0PP17_9CHLO|nr:hypothetical protein Rsub_11707 [Raphidocelis subcapitata]|eukprot:GBF98915.1 hypothetical protein Rsub_11707 [Raphidocelis subcapitata]